MATANLVKNGEFNSGAENWEFTLETPLFLVETPVIKNHFCRINPGQTVYQPLPLFGAGVTCRISYRVRGSAHGYVAIKNIQQNTGYASFNINTSLSKDWKDESVEFDVATVLQGPLDILFEGVNTPSVEDYIEIDDVKFVIGVNGNYGENVIKSGDFESALDSWLIQGSDTGLDIRSEDIQIVNHYCKLTVGAGVGQMIELETGLYRLSVTTRGSIFGDALLMEEGSGRTYGTIYMNESMNAEWSMDSVEFSLGDNDPRALQLLVRCNGTGDAGDFIDVDSVVLQSISALR